MTSIQKAREELRGQLALLHSLANDTTEANWRDKRLYILQTCVRMSDALAALDAETEVNVEKTYCAMLSTGVCDMPAKLEAAESALAEARKVIEPFALPEGWHFIAYNKTGSTACSFNAGEVEILRRFLEETK